MKTLWRHILIISIETLALCSSTAIFPRLGNATVLKLAELLSGVSDDLAESSPSITCCTPIAKNTEGQVLFLHVSTCSLEDLRGCTCVNPNCPLKY